MFAFVLTAALLFSGAPKDFWNFWGDGKAELSSYKIKISRYGELREGYSVLVFVTEDIHRQTRIKVESADVPQKDRVPVLKLNRIIKFPTGIYDYSVMTSTFSAVESELGRAPFQPMKISFTAQEWCGHVMQMLIPHEKEAGFTLHSYFQREGDQQRKLALPENAVYEDNLPIWIRELKGEVLAPGEKRTITILPAMWSLRSRHAEVAFVDGWIQKEAGEKLAFKDESIQTWKWTWQVGNRQEVYWVEKAYPRRIMKWQSSDGGEGVLQESMRLPYWSLHDNDDLHYRKELKIE